MHTSDSALTPGHLAFIALCHEYCVAVENARETPIADFTGTMLRILPRIYIAASDLKITEPDDPDSFIDSVMDEDYYEAMRREMETLFGPDDTYLEVFEEDMKYSDTPIAASISESLADLLQVFYNFLETVKDAPESIILSALYIVEEDFRSYWSRILLNVLRPLNAIRYQQ